MKTWKGMLALLLVMLFASSCATLTPPAVEVEEEEAIFESGEYPLTGPKWDKHIREMRERS